MSHGGEPERDLAMPQPAQPAAGAPVMRESGRQPTARAAISHPVLAAVEIAAAHVSGLPKSKPSVICEQQRILRRRRHGY